MPNLMPTHDLALGQRKSVVYGTLLTVFHVLVHIVGDHQVNLHLVGHKRPQLIEQGVKGFFVYPVV